MIALFRDDFNARFRLSKHRSLLSRIAKAAGVAPGFRIAETPVFLPYTLLHSMAATGADLLHSLLGNPDYMAASAQVVPEPFRTQRETSHPHFLAADFALAPAADGSLKPVLIEMQAFPSIAAFVVLLAEQYRSTYALDPALDCFLGGHSEASFRELLTRTILGDHPPENVVLLELDAPRQKTFADLKLTARQLGIRIVDPAELVPDPQSGGRHRLCYRAGRRLVPITRIYNRAIPEEWLRRGYVPRFAPHQFPEVEWATHPAWYYRVSKFSLPWLTHSAVPPAVFLDQWLDGHDQELLPPDPAQWVLKPLFDFSGHGIRFAPTPESLRAIPPTKRCRYLLQQRVHPVRPIHTPRGSTQVEVRILYLWPENGRLEPVLPLIRLGRGQRMGVEQNQSAEWTGVSMGFYPRTGESGGK